MPGRKNNEKGIHGCTFTANLADEMHGGAIALSSTNLVITNSSFVNNTAGKGGGGALYWEPALTGLYEQAEAPRLDVNLPVCRLTHVWRYVWLHLCWLVCYVLCAFTSLLARSGTQHCHLHWQRGLCQRQR